MSLDTHQAQIITEVYNKMYKQLLAYARNSLGQEYLVEESVQDTFRIACAKYDEFIGSPNPEGWLMITLRNIIRNTRREQAKLSRMFVKAISSGDEVYSESYIIAAEDKNIEKAETNLYFSGMLTKDEYFLTYTGSDIWIQYSRSSSRIWPHGRGLQETCSAYKEKAEKVIR